MSMLELLASLVSDPVNLFILALTLTLVYTFKPWLFHSKDYPPMPCLPVPLLGHMIYMRSSPRQALIRWRKKAGDIYTVYMGGKLTVVLSAYELMHEALVKKADAFSDRPPSARSKIVPDSDQLGILSSSHGLWKEQRTVALGILRSFGMGKNIMAEKINREVEIYLKTLSGFNGEPRDIQILTNSAVSNVICTVLIGDRFDYTDPFFVQFVKQNQVIIRFGGAVSLLTTYPWLAKLPGDLFGANEFKRTTLELNNNFGTHFINKFRDCADSTTNDNFIKGYFREMKTRREAGQDTTLDEENLKRNIENLFLAGSETTSTTILWALVFAVQFPEYQKKVYQEIVEVVGTERLPDMHDKTKLNFLTAYIMETQRHASIGPIGLPHMCSQTTQVGGYTIPAGATVLTYLDGLLKDPKTWGDADTFRPGRFLDKDENVVANSKFVPFSMGRRVCMGEALAKMELYLFLAGIFQQFEVLPESPNNTTYPDGPFGITISPKPFKIRFKARQRVK